MELFRATNKALTISGLDLRQGRSLGNIDNLMDWCVFFGEKHKPAPAAAITPSHFNGNGHGLPYSLDEIELIVSSGTLPPGANRSDLFHAIIGHYVGCGWDAEQITAHIGQFPDGIGGRYLSEGRLSGEVDRSVGKYNAGALPAPGVNGWVNDWEARAPQPDPELDDDIPEQKPSDPDPELDDDVSEQKQPPRDPSSGSRRRLNSTMTNLIRMRIRNRRSTDLVCRHSMHTAIPIRGRLRAGAIKHLIPVCGHGLLSGQWGACKTFVVFELAAALGSGQPFLGRVVKRQCGVLLIAAEGANEVRLRLDAVVRAKCGGMQRAPFRWYETAPMLLHKDSVETLIAMARAGGRFLTGRIRAAVGPYRYRHDRRLRRLCTFRRRE